MANNDVAVQEFYLDLSQLSYTGENLVRPESILAQRDGTLWVSDGRGGITRIDPSGTQHFLPGLGGEPNGLAMLADGSLLIANIAGGAVQHWYPDGHTENFLTEVDGVPITTPNFVFRDSQERIWIAVSTRAPIWWPAAAEPRPDGYIVLVDEHGPRIVADGIFFTNEIRLDVREEYLYVAETMGRHIL